VAEIPGWSPELERSFKKVLFQFLEDIHSTKAALYLLSGDGSYLLVTQYGFGRRDRLAAEYAPQHPVVLKARELRNEPRAFRLPDEFPEVAAYLEAAGTGHLLLVPLFAASRVFGFVDARDKGGRRPFLPADLRRARAIGRALIDLLARCGIYPELEAETGGPAAEEEAAAGRIEPAGNGLDPVGMADVCAVLQRVVPGRAGLACVTVIDDAGAGSIVFAAGQPEAAELTALRRHQSEVLKRRHLGPPPDTAWNQRVLLRPGRRPPGAARTVATDVLLEAPGWCLVGSVVTDRTPGEAEDLLGGIREAAGRARRDTGLRYIGRLYARSLVEPHRARAPELVQHLEAVSRLAWRLSLSLGLDEARAEEAAVAGLVHDLGLADLAGRRVLRHPSPGSEEHRLYRSHVETGAEKLRTAGFIDLAAVVRHHHERWDGGGYPDRLAGEAIPLLSRITHVAEVYDVLVAKYSYRNPVEPGKALSIMRAAAGHQFDPTIVEALAQIVATP